MDGGFRSGQAAHVLDSRSGTLNHERRRNSPSPASIDFSHGLALQQGLEEELFAGSILRYTDGKAKLAKRKKDSKPMKPLLVCSWTFCVYEDRSSRPLQPVSRQVAKSCQPPTVQRLGGGAITTSCRDGVGVFNRVKSSGGKSPLGLARLGDSGGAGWLATTNDGAARFELKLM
ncbi:hypothetical protein M440DRAFT_1389353 [Trichoderma longibrachiatum ATCC 18648]|uniref:Uncharacterized protein n=1 Tax=Trichoderma longibrachiatum ATCC 18648 TaxID=983965 RepID=A0A2T4CCR3_TRILO|nr:hypothetical protein M440DRAFT_1389353 [Trichoderma longibrachiatum ATCC 18648]